MKNLVIIGLVGIMLSCKNSNNDVEAAKKAAIDSMNNIAALEAKQRTIDSLNLAASHHHSASGNNQTVVTTTEKKKMSNKTKGALIGTGAGILTGVIAGAVIDKENPGQGAAIGGAVGGAVGSGIGYGAGSAKDKKAAKTKTTTTKP